MSQTVAHDKRPKKQKQKAFLEKFEECCSISKASRYSKIPRRTVYQWEMDDPEFKREFDRSRKIVIATLEDEAARRAYEGNMRPVFQGGKKVGNIREYSDTLLIFLLKGLAPEKYRERFEHTGKGGTDLFSGKSDDELTAILKSISSKLDVK